jgi:two-component system sensor histidine kinase BaeS
MARWEGPWISRTGLRLALAIVAISFASIGTVVAVAAATVGTDVNELVGSQVTDLTRALALASAAAHGHAGWDGARLTPVLDIVEQEGAAARVRGSAGQVIRSTPGFARFPRGPVRRQPVLVGGRTVGSVTVRFDHRGLAATIDHYETLRWRVRIAAGIAALLVALVMSVLVSRRLTAPAGRLIRAARAMAAGDSTARVGKVRGVTEVRELSATFDQMAEALEHEARVRRDMVADIAHELRAPIAVLQAGQEAMLDGLTDLTRENLASLQDEVQRLAQTAGDLQVLASAEPAALQFRLGPHDLAAIVADAADSLAGAIAAADVHLVSKLQPVRVICDSRRMHEVAVNLLGNAVKFTRPGGHVAIETGPASGSSGRRAMLQVRDTGVGIPPDELQHVSERYFRGQLASSVAGSGIGLAVVDQIVRAHRGQLDIVSEPGQGTQVTITLPMAVG